MFGATAVVGESVQLGEGIVFKVSETLLATAL